jgi:hypothetical protein
VADWSGEGGCARLAGDHGLEVAATWEMMPGDHTKRVVAVEGLSSGAGGLMERSAVAAAAEAWCHIWKTKTRIRLSTV